MSHTPGPWVYAMAPELLEIVQRVCDWDKKWPKYSDTTGSSERELNKLCEDAAIVLAKAKEAP